jgi:sortase B
MEEKRKKKKTMYTIIGIASLSVALVCAVIIGVKQYRLWKSQQIYEKLAQSTTVLEVNSTEEVQSEEETTQALEGYKKEAVRLMTKYGIQVPEKNIDFDAMHKEISEDIYAWIYIPNTHIDYPVFQHPTDNSYYLEHNIDGSEGYPGCIYTENYNSKDFSDPHTVIYGHNMRDTTMFSDLHLYEDEEFFENNRYVYIYTEDMVYVYKIFAAYQTNNAHQLLNYDFSNKSVVKSYLENTVLRMEEPKVYDEDTEFSEDDQILTLSTCVMTERQFHLRYIVQSLRLK